MNKTQFTKEVTKLQMTSTPLYRDLIQIISSRLTSLLDKPEETADGIVRALWHKAAGLSVSVQHASELELPMLDDPAIVRLRDLVAQRLAGVPLAYLTGLQQFMGLELLVDRGALIPRKETELLCQSAIDALRGMVSLRETVMVVDVCTGSGNLAVAVAHYVPQARVFASDLSPEAVALARRNARHFGLEERVEVREGDLFAPFENSFFYGNVDLLTCNPPYISSRKVDTLPDEIIGHEPRLAFDGGPFGVKILNRFIQESPRFLRKGGRIVFEVGLGQGPAILQKLRSNGTFREVVPIKDRSDEVRVITACY
jgi:release factor glutamine methyltransferase